MLGWRLHPEENEMKARDLIEMVSPTTSSGYWPRTVPSEEGDQDHAQMLLRVAGQPLALGQAAALALGRGQWLCR